MTVISLQGQTASGSFSIILRRLFVSVHVTWNMVVDPGGLYPDPTFEKKTVLSFEKNKPEPNPPLNKQPGSVSA